MTTLDAYAQEVIDAHIEIARWLSGEASQDALPALLARFSPDFTMITPAGALLDHAGLVALFGGGYGKRPGLTIAIDAMQTVAADAGTGLVIYREHQVDGLGNATWRRSSAAFIRDGAARPCWRHLHETFCTA